ncbi:MAG TPA: hypothetical protein VGR16_13635, partial [Thermomicrobiales bacterium]|nr:hypothetical protein [Thermomicrobiales bacterium]
RWYRGALRDEVGPMNPPIADLNSALDRLARVAREVARHAEREAMRIIIELSEPSNEHHQVETESITATTTAS